VNRDVLPRETHCHAAVQLHGGFYCPLSELANSASPVVDVKSIITLNRASTAEVVTAEYVESIRIRFA